MSAVHKETPVRATEARPQAVYGHWTFRRCHSTRGGWECTLPWEARRFG